MAKKKNKSTASKKTNSSTTKKNNINNVLDTKNEKTTSTKKKTTSKTKTSTNPTTAKKTVKKVTSTSKNKTITNAKKVTPKKATTTKKSIITISKQKPNKQRKIENERETKNTKVEVTLETKEKVEKIQKEVKPKKREIKQESLEEIMKRVDKVSAERKNKNSKNTTKKTVTRSEKNRNILDDDKFNNILEKLNNNDDTVNIEEVLKKSKIKNANQSIKNVELPTIDKEKINKSKKETSHLSKIEIIPNEKKDNVIKPKKRVLNKVIIIVTYILLLLILIFACFKCYSWIKDNKKIEKQVKKINETVEVEETPDTENVEVIEQPENNRTGQYWNYLNMKLINVNFNELKNQNKDTVGWIQVNGTNINYPFVQTTNNDYYLTHAFDNTYNDAGWVFLDYRNNIKDLNKNTIIYAHSRLDTSMFGTLKNVLHTEWINNPDNFIIKLSMESENTMWQVFSVYHIPTTSDYLQIDFYSNNEFLEFGNMLLNRSAYNFNTGISENDKILTLSTCYSDTEKTVLHAKLIKREVRQ